MLRAIIALLLVASWSLDAVQATGIRPPTCPPPGRPVNGGHYDGFRPYYPLGKVINYYCNRGYTLQGRRWTVCLYDQRQGTHWLYPPPVCRPIIRRCETLQNPANGQVRLTGTTAGSLARYSCNNGFSLVGDSTRQCLANSQWSGRAPICRPIGCDRLDDPSNGRVRFDSTTVGSRAFYTCNAGFVLVGRSTRTCQFNGQWSGEAPVCRPIGCDRLDDPSNGRVRFDSTTVGSRAFYTCNAGFVLVGRSTRTCQFNGQWSGEAPVCRPVRCDRLDDIRNGRVDLSGTSVGSTATYSCDRGFVLVGNATRVCQANGEWSGQEPFCRIVDCGNLPDPAFGRVVLTGTTLGSTATYSCRQGYTLVGVSTRRCRANGQWSGQAPVCRSVRCDRLDDIRNGRVDLSGTSVGSTATYSCDRGFVLVGSATRVCQANGEWSGQEPFCRIVDCGNLPDPAFGRVVLTGTTLGSTATYSCRQGYTLVGVSTRRCRANGQWSGQAPVCEIVDCGNLPDPRFGRVVLSGTTFGSIATYTCQRGFVLVGQSTRTCQANGEWSGEAPVCRIVSCGNLPDPQFGRVVLTGTVFGSTATYSCQRGYVLVGQSTRTCQANGEWSGEAPICKIVDCGNLPNPNFGRVVLTGTTFGSTATYSCQRGYVLVGTSTRICQANGQWSGQAPVCRIVGCGSLPDPEFGEVVLTGTTVGSTATYSCQRGYVLVGQTTRICQANGEWSGEAPICRIIDCGNLPNPQFGRVVLTGTTLGSTATYSCQRGYVLEGQSTRTCQANGQWSGQAPICRIVDCGNLPNPRFGKVVLTGTTLGSTATYTCQRGYVLVGQTTRTCQANGQWSGEAPVCRIVDCGNLPDPRFGEVVLTGTTLGSTATYSCQKGYVLVGISTRTCQANGQWSGEAPVCRLVDCGDLPDPRFGSVELTGTTFGSTATYSCREGYTLAGTSTRTCQANGQWSGTAPVCQINRCGRLPDIENGRVIISGTTVGSRAAYSCNPGFLLVGDATRICQSNGQWSGREPFCRSIECERLQDIENGRVALTGTTVGSRASYRCNQGFILVGNAIRICQKSGEWSGREPVCRIVDCGGLQDPRFGSVELTGTTFGSTVTYSCQEGYVLVGSSTRTCQANGQWTRSPPICRISSCGTLESPQFGRVVLTGTSFGSTATYSCQRGYVLVGESTRICQANGQWSGEAPSCRIIDCGSLERPDFGAIELTGTTFGSFATYSCQQGYVLAGSPTRVCRANGEWSGSAPICRIVDCGSLSAPRFGSVELTGTIFGSTATYSCQQGYTLIGDATRNCQANGQWSGFPPFCRAVDCGPLRNPRFGKVVLSGTTTGSTATYSCFKGYVLVGDSTRICLSGGQWSGSAPTCKVVECEQTLEAPENGFIHVPCTNVHCTAVFWCESGYTLVGERTRTCQPSGQWSNDTPTC